MSVQQKYAKRVPAGVKKSRFFLEKTKQNDYLETTGTHHHIKLHKMCEPVSGVFLPFLLLTFTVLEES